MKRVVSFLLIVALFIPLSACGGTAAPAEETQSQQDVTTVLVEEPTAEPTATEAAPTPFPEVQIVEADWVSLKATSIEQDSQGGYSFTFSVKNGLDAGITGFIVFAFNGWIATEDTFSFTAEPKAEETEQFSVPAEFFLSCGVDAVNEIILQYTLYSDDHKSLVIDSAKIYPLGEEAAKSATAYQYVTEDSDIQLCESEDAIVAVTNFGINSENGCSMTFYVENTSDKTLIFKLSSCGINEYVSPLGIFSPKMLPGTRFLKTCTIDAEDLAKDGITEITRVDYNFSLLDNSDLSDVFVGTKTFYPSGTETPRVERTPLEGEVVLVDNADFTIIVTACLDKPGSSRYGMSFYVENKTDKEVSIEVQNAEVNGEPCLSNSTIADLPAGMRTNALYTWNTDAFEKAGLTDDTVVEQVTLPIYIISDGNRKAGDEVYKHTFKVKVW